MAKSLFEQLGGTYRKESDYLIPCLTVPAEEEQSIGIWGQRHLNYLKRHNGTAKGRECFRMDRTPQ